jgi:hypothetical protein
VSEVVWLSILCGKVDTYLVIWRALKPICQVDSEKVEGVMDGGRNAAWVCCVDLIFISGGSLVGVA